jgi:hypothetical protein
MLSQRDRKVWEMTVVPELSTRYPTSLVIRHARAVKHIFVLKTVDMAGIPWGGGVNINSVNINSVFLA